LRQIEPVTPAAPAAPATAGSSNPAALEKVEPPPPPTPAKKDGATPSESILSPQAPAAADLPPAPKPEQVLPPTCLKPIKIMLPPDPPPPPLTRAPSNVRWLTDLGVVYFRQHQFHEACHCFSRASEQGFAPAQFCLAVCYFNGQGAAPDPAAAIAWLRAAAAQRDANAEFALGMAYRLGQGVAASEELAKQWLRQAAGHGHGEAVKQLGEATGGNDSARQKTMAPVPPATAAGAASPAAMPAKPRQDLQRMILSLFRKK
jgi:hypothetical protein